MRSCPAAPLLAALLLAVFTWPQPAAALDYVRFNRGEALRQISGRLLLEAQDGGLLMQSRDGTLWAIQPDELDAKAQDDKPFVPFSQEEMSQALRSELPQFNIYTTRNYVVAYNTSREYAQWCGALLERLYAGFTGYWSQRQFDLQEPEFPMVALVFSDRQSYEAYAQQDVGSRVSSIIGYYNLRTNRVTMYDMTGIENLRRFSGGRLSSAQINQLLSRPEAERTVATVIHEATHQVAFNTGLHTRYADIPLWVSEGVAVYFETPDLRSRRGWRTIGDVNRVRLQTFRQYLRERPARSLESLLASDDRFRDSRQAESAYAEAWALNYFLIRTKPDEYAKYMQHLAEKKRMIWDDQQLRLDEFRQFFGPELAELDQEFIRYMQRVR